MTSADRADGAPAERVLPAPDASRLAEVFGARADLAQRYAELLAGDGVDHGLIGPREVPHLWERHIYNCACLADVIPLQVRIVDVGSGAGLPGLVLAIRRPDLSVDLVEPTLRRTQFLTSAVTALGLEGQVRVVRGRAEDPAVRGSVGSAPFVTARAVAPLDRLVRWCVPLLEVGGTMLAMKGQRAAEELSAASAVLASVGGTLTDVVEIGCGPSATRVVRIARTPPTRSTRKGSR